MNVLILCPKNALYQWRDELNKICPTIPVTLVPSKRPKKSGFKSDAAYRKNIIENFSGGILLCNYHRLYNEREIITKAP